MPVIVQEINLKETRPWMMETKFWIGERRMEAFKLWLASLITLYSYRATDRYWIDKTKAVLNSLSDAYLNEESAVLYGVFVDELADNIQI